MTIVAPLAAAVIAAWIVAWSQPAGQTVMGAAAAAGSAPASGSVASVAATSATHAKRAGRDAALPFRCRCCAWWPLGEELNTAASPASRRLNRRAPLIPVNVLIAVPLSRGVHRGGAAQRALWPESP